MAGIATITTGDLNGDGLFDIVVGKTNGRVAVIYNTGTKTEPKWGQPVELKGDAGTKPSSSPADGMSATASSAEISTAT